MGLIFCRKLAAVLCLSLLAPLAARAQAEAATPNVAILSLIGDKITVETFLRSTGSNMDGNRKRVLPVGGPVLDVEALQSANTTFKRLRPGIKTTLLATADQGLYEAQNALFDEVDANKDNRIYLGSLLKNRAVTQLILITKQRSYTEFKVENGRVGSGRLEGVGFYIDNETRLMNGRSLASGSGFIAAFVYAKMRLVDAETLNVLKEVNIKESDLNINYALTSAHLAAWDTLTSEQKVTRLNEVIAGAMGDAVTELLKP
jgi:hypothetical protein